MIRLILNNEENKKVFLVREYFRLATFGHYSRRIPQPVVLKLARDGYFCDPDGTIRCFKCYRELPLSAIHIYGVHNRCRSSYRLENMSIANSYGHLSPDWILAVNQQNQNNDVIRGLQSFDDVVLNRPTFPQQVRRQLLHFQENENVFSLEMERRRRMFYSGRTIDLQAFRERPRGIEDSYSSVENINIQFRGSVNPIEDPMNQMLDDFERNNTGDLLNSHTDSSMICHMNTTLTSASFGNYQGQQLPAIVREIEEQAISTIFENNRSSDLFPNQPDEQISIETPAAPVVTDSALSDETYVKQIYELVSPRNFSNTIVTDIQRGNQELPANIINSTHQTSSLTHSPCDVREETEPLIAACFRGSNTHTIDTGTVQPEQFQKQECKDSIIPAADIHAFSRNSEHGEDNQPENVDLALQTSPGPKQTSQMTLCDKSVHGPHTGNSLKQTVTEPFNSIRKRHPSQPTSDKNDSEASKHRLLRRNIRARHYSEPTVVSKSKPSSTVAQAFCESIEDSFTPRSEQRDCSLARSDPENKPFRRLDHSDESASAKVPNNASCFEIIMPTLLPIENTDVSETEQNQGAAPASQSRTSINSSDRASEHQNRRRRNTV